VECRSAPLSPRQRPERVRRLEHQSDERGQDRRAQNNASNGKWSETTNMKRILSHARQRIASMLLGPLIISFGSVAIGQTASPSDALLFFDGTWHCDGVFPGSGRKISSNLSFKWLAKTGAVLKQHDDEPPNGYHAVELWVASKGGFQALIGDSFGGSRFFSSTGWVGESLTWDGDSDPAHREKFVYVKGGFDTMRIDWMVSKNAAAFVVGDTLTCSRKKG
jgi:hypothetical protein